MAHQSEYKTLLTGSTLRLKSLDYGWWLKLSNELRLTACEDKCSALTVSIFKNYMRSGKNFSRASIWDQPGLSSSICLEVTKERRHSQNSWILLFFFHFLAMLLLSNLNWPLVSWFLKKTSDLERAFSTLQSGSNQKFLAQLI